MFKKISIALAFGILGLTGIASADADKITVCHVTGSSKNPIVQISVALSALPAHLAHGDFLIPVGDIDCFGGGLPFPE